jgi:tetratricopeptide (TPR) repeat protein
MEQSPLDRQRLKLVYYRLALCYIIRGEFLSGQGFLRRILAETAKPNAQTLKAISQLGISNLLVKQDLEILSAYATQMLGRTLLYQGYIKKSLPLLEQGCAMMNQIGEVNIGSESQAGLGIALAASGQYSKGLELAERALQQALIIGDTNIIGMLYSSLSSLHLNGLNLEKVLEASSRAIEEMKKIEGISTQQIILLNQAIAETMLGRHEVARQRISEAQEIGNRFDEKYPHLGYFTLVQALMALQTGEYEEAIALSKQALELSKAEDNIGGRGNAELIWGQALTALGGAARLAEAEIHLENALAAAEEGGAVIAVAQVHSAWGDLCLKRGERAGMLEHYRQALAIFERAGLHREVKKVQEKYA